MNYILQVDAIFTCNFRDVKAQKPARRDGLGDWNPDFRRGSCQTIARMKQDPEHIYPKAGKTEFLYKTHVSLHPPSMMMMMMIRFLLMSDYTLFQTS
jgi:hypothetical protein